MVTNIKMNKLPIINLFGSCLGVAQEVLKLSEFKHVVLRLIE